MTTIRILGVMIGTIAIYTWIANAIPQIESAVPEELSFSSDVSEAELVAAGAELYSGGAGCTTCHGLETRAPHLLTASPARVRSEHDAGPGSRARTVRPISMNR